MTIAPGPCRHQQSANSVADHTVGQDRHRQGRSSGWARAGSLKGFTRRGPAMQHLDRTLAAGPAAPGAARRALRDWLLKRRCEDAAIDTARSWSPRPVTNAVLHTAEPGVCLTVDEAGTVMRAAVRDSSSKFPGGWPKLRPEIGTGGRGLFLVELLSVGWGWEPLRDGKRGWFEVPCRSASDS
jgi:hypothetical protein